MRRGVSIIVFLAILAGCGKKSSDTDETTGQQEASKEVKKEKERQASGKSHTIAFAKKEPGAKYQVIVREWSKRAVTTNGKTITSNDGREEEFIEIVDDVTAKKLSRSYQVARSYTDNGPKKDYAYANKKVTIEKVGDLYTFSVGAKQLSPAESSQLSKEFGGPIKTGESTIPKHPVKVGESWDINDDDVRRMYRVLAPLKFDKDKCTFKAKLSDAYMNKDNEQWGTIETAIHLAPLPGEDEQMEMTINATREGAIDGSSPAVTISKKLRIEYSQGKSTRVIDETTETISVELIKD